MTSLRPVNEINVKLTCGSDALMNASALANAFGIQIRASYEASFKVTTKRVLCRNTCNFTAMRRK